MQHSTPCAVGATGIQPDRQTHSHTPATILLCLVSNTRYRGIAFKGHTSGISHQGLGVVTRTPRSSDPSPASLAASIHLCLIDFAIRFHLVECDSELVGRLCMGLTPGHGSCDAHVDGNLRCNLGGREGLVADLSRSQSWVTHGCVVGGFAFHGAKTASYVHDVGSLDRGIAAVRGTYYLCTARRKKVVRCLCTYLYKDTSPS